jgi:hypothetical protein
MLNASQLADRLSVTKGRVSQYLSEGKLEGCYSGEGRGRRFDLEKVCVALGKRLDQGQVMGNGAATRRAIAGLQRMMGEMGQDLPVMPAAPPSAPRDGAELPPTDDGRYTLARAQKAEEEARRLRRQNLQDEGAFVLASEVERQVARVLAQEVAEFEAVLRSAARAVADRLGVDFRVARQIMIDTWRAHRLSRSGALASEAEAAQMTDAERGADV